MLGKAVKFRHCPATVSATVRHSFGMTADRPDEAATGALLREGNPAISASQETGPLCFTLRSEGNGGTMSRFFWRHLRTLLFASLLLSAPILQAVTVHGTVTDSLGRPISNATVALVQNGKVIVSTSTHYDGTYQLSN